MAREFLQWMSWDQMLVHAHCSARLDNMTDEFPFKAGFYSGQLWFNSGSFWRWTWNKLSDSAASPKLISWLCCLSHINNTKLLKKTTDGSGRASILLCFHTRSLQRRSAGTGSSICFFFNHTNKRIYIRIDNWYYRNNVKKFMFIVLPAV